MVNPCHELKTDQLLPGGPRQVRLITFMPSSVRAVDVTLCPSTSKTTVSFTLQGRYALPAGHADETVPWQQLLSWALGGDAQQQQQDGDDGDASPVDDMVGHCPINQHLKSVSGPDGEANEAATRGHRTVSDSVD